MKDKFAQKQPKITWRKCYKAKPRKIRYTYYVYVDKETARVQHFDNLSPVYVYVGYENIGRKNERAVIMFYPDKRNMVGKVEK